MKKFAALVLLGMPLAAGAKIIGFGGGGFFLIEDDEELFAITAVIGEATAEDADMALEADGFDLGGSTERCYPRGTSAAAGEVIGQSPPAGSLQPAGTLVYVTVSDGNECKLSGRPGVRLPGFRFPGL
jgi:hypothetical protein